MTRVVLVTLAATAVAGAGCTDGKGADCTMDPTNASKSDTRAPPCVDGRLWANSSGSDSYCFAYANHACQQSPIERPLRLAPYTFERWSNNVTADEARGSFQWAAGSYNGAVSNAFVGLNLSYSMGEEVAEDEGFSFSDDGQYMIGMVKPGAPPDLFSGNGPELGHTYCNLAPDGSGYDDCDITVSSGVRAPPGTPDPGGKLVGGVL